MDDSSRNELHGFSLALASRKAEEAGWFLFLLSPSHFTFIHAGNIVILKDLFIVHLREFYFN